DDAGRTWITLVRHALGLGGVLRGPALHGTIGLTGGVGHHRVQPRGEKGVALETVDLARHPKQRVLARLLGVLAVRKEARAAPQPHRPWHAARAPPTPRRHCSPLDAWLRTPSRGLSGHYCP